MPRPEDCTGMFQPVSNYETDDPMFRCTGCGEVFVIHQGKRIIIKEGDKD